MTPQEIDDRLARTFEDRRLSRGERHDLAKSLGTGTDRALIRQRAFAFARAALTNAEDGAVLEWLEDVVKAIGEATAGGVTHVEAHFSPGDDCPRTIGSLLAHARRSADICVFTITDDRLAEAILDAHRRHVAVRIITDNEKAEDLGSDVGRFEAAGIPLRVDRSPFHMHHKFAILDGATLLTGSYNWTRGAARDNEENLIVTDDSRLIAPFTAAFTRLWARLA